MLDSEAGGTEIAIEGDRGGVSDGVRGGIGVRRLDRQPETEWGRTSGVLKGGVERMDSSVVMVELVVEPGYKSGRRTWS